MSRLRSDTITLAYDADPIVRDVALAIPDGRITTIIGPNGCGKSTLLRALARLMKPASGAVILDGQLIHQLPTREVAKRLGLLHQQPAPPGGITVEGLVARGRYPHQSFLQPPSRRDAAAVDRALELTGMQALRQRPVDQLSGGQRQRAWMAMALAQETALLLLDEPTTFLDIAHQLEVIELIQRLNAEEGRTIVMVLHDVNEAARASHRIVALAGGRIVREGTPEEVIEPGLLAELYGVACDIHRDPISGLPVCVPRSRLGVPPAPSPGPQPAFVVDHLQAGYAGTPVLHDVSTLVPSGQVTAIVGPNACGKSTLLRACARLLAPTGGVVRFSGDDVRRGSHKALARRLALLTQGPQPPSGFLVEDLVAAGRIPHQSLLRQWRAHDEAAVERALERCDLCDLRYREVQTLSGGQRQRAWIAMALAQQTEALLLDEPTTFLDIAAQVDLLELVRELNRREGRTVVMVLHDLAMAARYADQVIVMSHGTVVAAGPPADVLTSDLLREVFEIDAFLTTDPHTGALLILPNRALTPQAPRAVTLEPVRS